MQENLSALGDFCFRAEALSQRFRRASRLKRPRSRSVRAQEPGREISGQNAVRGSPGSPFDLFGVDNGHAASGGKIGGENH